MTMNNNNDASVYEAAVLLAGKERSRTLTPGERIDILLLHSHMRQAGELHVSRRIAAMLHRKVALVQEVWSTFLATGGIITKQKRSGNRIQHLRRIPRTALISTMVQTFVRERTVAKDVLALLMDNGVLTADRTSPKSMLAALRVVQRYVTSLGYKRGNKKRRRTGALNDAPGQAGRVRATSMRGHAGHPRPPDCGVP